MEVQVALLTQYRHVKEPEITLYPLRRKKDGSFIRARTNQGNQEGGWLILLFTHTSVVHLVVNISEPTNTHTVMYTHSFQVQYIEFKGYLC